MNVKELITELKKLPQDLPIRVEPIDDKYVVIHEDNAWVYDVQVIPTGVSGYEISGEVILMISE
tara:strand:- start:5587 stop:5778 length:192 start_codon:yes stop_codon:yes gene_type:complete